ncbi:cell division cycle protein 27 homolog [Oppia nitens]|uniref:cell division cycle protein 27 homolog n=1 Tax=Oppia nitens TaxID=1686743 RepID=UPI0023DAE4B4|nr:cell division cycle protein 27 homolog [Oppia nitens]
MIVTEPVQATIQFALKHYAYNDAIFLAERLHSEVSSDESLHLLATCYYQSGKPNAAFSILASSDSRTSQCQLLLARCCFDLKKYNEAEEALVGNLRNDRNSSRSLVNTFTVEELRKEFGESASFAAQLLAQICGKIERHSQAMHYYRESLKANPFLWSSYENLIQLGNKVDPKEIFNITNVEFSQCLGSNPLVNLLNANGNSNANINRLNDTNCITSHLQSIITKCEITSPFAVIKNTNENGTIDVITPENNQWVTAACLAPQKLNNKITRKSTTTMRNENVINKNLLNSQTTPVARHCFGVFPLTDMPTITIKSAVESDNCQNTHSDELQAKKPHTRRSQQQIQQTQPSAIGTQSTRSNAFKLQLSNNQHSDSVSTVSSLSGSPIQSQSLRRSSRLFSSSQSSIKENTGSKAPTKLIARPRTPTKRTKRTNSSTNISSLTNNSSILQKETDTELNDINKSEINKNVSNYDLMQTGIKMQKQSAKGLLDLLVQFGTALQHLGQFRCKDAIKALENLPVNHVNTGWVLTSLGRAYFEMSRYEESVKYFMEAHRHEPHRLHGMEYLSTALWHLQREVELSTLAQELNDYDKDSAQTWCVAGNCFSLQKEHETSIKFLQRAIQVDPDFAYAYTLLGHELAVTDEMDHAMSCFRNATRIDPRHYNAWYGIGMIYYKQEKFQLAELHYRKALDISPFSPVLMCHIGVVQHALKQSHKALETLERAIDMDPKNALCKFHKASILFALDRHDRALEELEQLKQIVPKESLVYFLIGKVHKKMGDTHLALMNFSWAMDLDPKGANNQIKEVIDKQYANDDEEVVVHLDPTETGGDNTSRLRSNSSSMEAEDSNNDVEAMIDDST